MKIIYLHQYFNTPRMSGGTRSYEMARRLVQAGHEVHVVTSDKSPDRTDPREYQTEEAGIQVHWIPVPYSNHMRFAARVKAFGKFAWLSAKRAASLKGEVVYATSTPLTIALPGVHAARRNGAPFVFEVRDLWPEVPIAMGALTNPLLVHSARALERYAYRNASRIVALSPGMKSGIVDQGFDPEKISVIPNSSDIELFDCPPERGEQFRSQHAWLQDRPLVVYTGTFGAVNGVGYLARLASETAKLNPDIRFLLIGGGQEEAAVRKLAEDLGVLNRNFFMMGKIPKQEIPSVLSAAHLATSTVIDVPALWANSANKFFDALAAGRPMAINHEGWLADLIREKNLGLVLDANKVAPAARTLVSFLQDQTAVQRARQAARQAAHEQFDRSILARKLEVVLLDAVGQSRSQETAGATSRRAA